MPELTPKQAHFAEEYLKDLNGTQAAIRVGVPPKNAHTQAAKWLANSKVAAELERRRNERSEQTQIDAAWVLRRLAAEATADVNDIYDENGALKPVKEWPLIWRQGLIAGIDVEEISVDGVKMGVVKKVKVSDRIRRLELIGKHIGVKAFEEQVSVKGLDQLADRLARAAQRNG